MGSGSKYLRMLQRHKVTYKNDSACWLADRSLVLICMCVLQTGICPSCSAAGPSRIFFIGAFESPYARVYD